MEWIVAAVFVLVGLVCAVAVWLGNRDPVTRRYKPDIGGLFRIGRPLLPPEHLRDKDSAGGGSEERRS